jgi:dihydrofolate reductase
MKISLILAMTRQGVIGRNNTLPWHIPEDLKRFRKLTSGHPIIMGRKTYDSIGKPLPNRTNIVVSRQAGLTIPGCEVFPDLSSALARCHELSPERCFVIGGAQIFKEALPLADEIYMTWVETNVEGDVRMEMPDLSQYRITFEERVEAPLPHTYIDYVR